MINQLLPKKHQFHDYFSQAADLGVEAARTLLQMFESNADADLLARRLKEIEHQCDEVTHQTMELLNRTFITPLDREDIHEVALKLDDVVDLCAASGNRFLYFKVGPATRHSLAM